MAGEKIDVDNKVLEDEITALTNLINDMETSGIKALEIKGDGKAKTYMDIVEGDFIKLLDGLKYLAECTLSCLNNVKDGYIEIDETTRDAIESFRNEVLSLV